MTKDMSARFLGDLDSNPASVLSMLEDFDSTKCVASIKEDQERVFEVIERTVGGPLLNSTVMCVLERWLYATLLTNRKSEALNGMEVICSRCHAIREQRIGADHPDTANSKRILLLIQRARTDADFLSMLVEKGWVAYELEEIQREGRAKTLEEERMLRQRADEIARLDEVDAQNDKRKKEEGLENLSRQGRTAEEEKREKDIETETARAKLAASHAAQPAEKFKCCNIA